MNKKSRSRKFSAKQSARLGAYFAAGVGASMAATSTSEAAIQVIDINSFNIGGTNGGLISGDYSIVYNFPVLNEAMRIFNAFVFEGFSTTTFTGLSTYSADLAFAINGGPASPKNFAFNDPIDEISTAPYYWSGSTYSVFRDGDDVSPNFGPGSYIGLRFGDPLNPNFGWLEVTWNSSANEFQILSGAYEDQGGVAILAGDTGGGPGPEPIPEPGTWAAAALLAGGAAFMRWRRRRDEAQKEAA